jgi:hypothetical protein
MTKPSRASSVCAVLLTLSLSACTDFSDPANPAGPNGAIAAGAGGLIGGAANAVGFLLSFGPSTVSGPVAMIMPSGEILRGTAASVLVGYEFATADEFAVRGGMLECRGRSDMELGNPVVSITIGCSDGRSGIGRVVRENIASSSGKLHMSDGTEASFVYGDAARGI